MFSELFQLAGAPADLTGRVAKSGYVFVERWQPEKSSEAIAAAVGRTLTFNGANVVHQLVAKTKAGPNRYSGIYGLSVFPFHTDMAHYRTPPRYLMLRCVRGYGSVSTNLIDGFALVERVGRSIMSKALVKPRRALNGSLPLYSLYQPPTSTRYAMIRWDEVFMVPASTGGQQGVARVQQEISAVPQISIPLQFPGDTLWIDNWRMLHGRSAIGVNQGDRLIHRAYFGELY